MGNYLYVRFKKPSPERTCISVDKLTLPIKKPGFWANYLHDLESIWWIIIWTIAHFMKASDFELRSPAYELEKSKKKTLTDLLFPGLSEERWKFLATDTFYEYLDGIPNSLPKVKQIAGLMKSRLISAYHKRENSMDICEPILVSDECTFHREFLKDLRLHPFEDVDIVPMWEVPSDNTNTAPKSKQTSRGKIGGTKGIEDDIRRVVIVTPLDLS